MTKKLLEMQKGFQTAFIDASYDSNLAYKPEFVYNDNKNGQKVFSTIEDELLHCDHFAISVAFITRGGVTPLLQTLQELERRGVDFIQKGIFFRNRRNIVLLLAAPT